MSYNALTRESEFRLMQFLQAGRDGFARLTLAEAADNLTKNLGFPVTPANIMGVVRDAHLDILFLRQHKRGRQSGPSSAQMFHKKGTSGCVSTAEMIRRLYAGIMDLSQSLGTVPSDLADVTPPSMEAFIGDKE